ncbi:hypothetical protein [Yokenella regensburgei]|uniref:hypothetical protein n=1 Tax=Yokenella regensburgei TaxID=158877 RepID=UPI000242262A|nr:hypothetical protein [Yokenella regensburgei]EHM50715.1 hypothetical protein HMPREF0880_00900 [Yokenella regensburgei ATCC 43003]
MYLDNPALTLRKLIISIESYSPNQPLRSALLHFFELESTPSSEPILWEKIAKVISLPNKISETLEDYFPDEEITAPNWKNNIISAFSNINLNARVLEFNNSISNETKNELGLLSLIFKTKGEIGKLESDDINEIQDLLCNLKQTVIDSDLNIELRKDILHYLNNIIRALDDYSITGIGPVISSVEATLGHACVSPPFQDIVKNTEIGDKIKTVLKKSLSAISTVEGVASLGANCVTLIEHFSK